MRAGRWVRASTLIALAVFVYLIGNTLRQVLQASYPDSARPLFSSLPSLPVVGIRLTWATTAMWAWFVVAGVAIWQVMRRLERRESGSDDRLVRFAKLSVLAGVLTWTLPVGATLLLYLIGPSPAARVRAASVTTFGVIAVLPAVACSIAGIFLGVRARESRARKFAMVGETLCALPWLLMAAQIVLADVGLG